MSDFVKLKDLCATITDGSHYSPPASSKGYPMLSSKDMNDTDFDYSHCKYIDEKEFQKMKHNGCVPLKDDVLIIKDGNNYLEKVFVVKETKEIAILSSIGILRPNTEIVDPYYIKYYLTSRFVKEEVAKKYVTGSALPRIILKNFGDIDMPYVNLNTQHRIVRVLKEFDDAIDNNNIISSELESLAKTIYDYWFLQFDFPDENGRPYKSSGGKMVWNEELKREIPEGWKVDKAGNYISLIRGVAYKPSDEKNSAVKNIVPLLKSNNIQNGKINFDSPVYLLAEKISPEQFLKDHSVFITMSSGSKAHMGKTAILYKSLPYAFGAFCARISINPKYRSFLSMYFVSDMFRKYIESVTSGTSINNISSEQLASIIIAFPPEKVLNKFEEILNPIFSKQGDIVMENYQLSSLRDFLLPMLMNGQVTFKEDA